MDDPAYGLSVADRARAIEVMLSAEDLDAGLAERYGWINRALPAISSQARRILRHAGEIVNHQLRSALVYQID
jgi:enoyl-CoA hydratase/carnithine racemase